MEPVRAAIGHVVQDTTARAALRGIVVAIRNDIHLLHGVQRGVMYSHALKEFVVLGAVEKLAVGLGRLSVGIPGAASLRVLNHFNNRRRED